MSIKSESMKVLRGILTVTNYYEGHDISRKEVEKYNNEQEVVIIGSGSETEMAEEKGEEIEGTKTILTEHDGHSWAKVSRNIAELAIAAYSSILNLDEEEEKEKIQSTMKTFLKEVARIVTEDIRNAFFGRGSALAADLEKLVDAAYADHNVLPVQASDNMISDMRNKKEDGAYPLTLFGRTINESATLGIDGLLNSSDDDNEAYINNSAISRALRLLNHYYSLTSRISKTSPLGNDTFRNILADIKALKITLAPIAEAEKGKEEELEKEELGHDSNKIRKDSLEGMIEDIEKACEESLLSSPEDNLSQKILNILSRCLEEDGKAELLKQSAFERLVEVPLKNFADSINPQRIPDIEKRNERNVPVL